MDKMLALAAGFSAVALSLSSFAGGSKDSESSVSYVFVSNTGDESLSLIRCETSHGKQPTKHKDKGHQASGYGASWYTDAYRGHGPGNGWGNSHGKNHITCEETDRKVVGFGTHWPANQYRGNPAWWWTGLSGEVVGVKAKKSLKPLENPNNLVYVDTYRIPGLPDSGSNFIGVSPGGRTAWNSAREVDRIQEIDTNPYSPSFGTILSEILVPDQDPTSPPNSSRGAARPCDATITPDGRYFFEPDLGGESLTVVDTKTKQIIYQVLPPLADGSDKVMPFMATTNGKIVLEENLELDNTYDVWDVRRLPDAPVHLKKITQDDGLGVDAQTSEFTPDGRYAYLIMRGMKDAPVGSGDASRIDVLNLDKSSRKKYLKIVNHIELPFNCRASTGDFSNDGAYFFVNCEKYTNSEGQYEEPGELVVIDNDAQSAVLSIPVGNGPHGVIVR